MLSFVKIDSTGYKTEANVPLKSVNCYVDIKERVAELVYDQHFVNEESTPIEASYAFPVPAEAAVFSFEAKLMMVKLLWVFAKKRKKLKRNIIKLLKKVILLIIWIVMMVTHSV